MSQPPAFRAVDATRPAAGYVGGKRILAARIAARIAAVPHAIYAEPFVGMGGVFLRRRQAAPSEVINDISGDVATFFRIVQRHYPALMDELKFRFTSRAEFARLMAVDPATCTDLERAVRFLYLQRTAFGGKVAGRSFGVSPINSGRFDVTKLGDILAAIAERLAGVVIENLPFDRFIARYDRTDTLFYCDPPYWGSEDYYGADLFPKTAFERLAGQLAAIKGRFLLSINDSPETRAIFGRFAIEAVPATYQLCASNAHAAGELIVASV